MTYRYMVPTVAGTGVMPGTVLLRDALERVTGLDIIGGYNRRCVVQCGAPLAVGASKCPNGHGISHHAESCAIDVMTTNVEMHRRVIDWCLGPEGMAYEVQEIVSGFSPIGGPGRWTVDTGWRQYTGPSPHRDHVHVSQTLTAARRTTPPELSEEDTMKFTLIRPAGFYDIALLGGVVLADGLTPFIVNDLVDADLVAGLQPGARNYDSHATVLEPDTWTAIVGRPPVGARPPGEV